MLYSEREVTMAVILDQVICGTTTAELAALKLKISQRTLYRRLKRYRAEGAAGLIHRNKGRESHRKVPESTWSKIEIILKNELSGFGPSHAQEKLAQEPYNIVISAESLRRRMRKLGFPLKKRRSRSPYRSKRPRKPYFGQLIQLDGSTHDWFGPRGPRCTLIALIDDATSKIVSLWFAPAESTFAVMEALKIYLTSYGIPLALYTDQHSIYRVTTKNAREAGALSQVELACKKLDIEVIHANSPQAKGRVERLFGFLQDRLVSELAYRAISSIDEANKVLPELTELLNKRYEKAPLLAGDANRPLAQHNLREILTINETRQLQNDWTFQYYDAFYQALKEQSIRLEPKENITIRTYPDGSKSFLARNKFIQVKRIAPIIRVLKTHPSVTKPKKPKDPFRFLSDAPPLGYKYHEKVTKSCGTKL